MASHLGKGFPPDRPPTQSRTHILRKEFNTEAAGAPFSGVRYSGALAF